MAVSPVIKVQVGTRRGEMDVPRDFPFTSDMVRVSCLEKSISDYRLNAWEIFKKLSLPTLQEEAWRRTDLKAFRPHIFEIHDGIVGEYQIPQKKSRLTPTESYSGQLLLSPGKIERSLDPQLVEKGVVFTDLVTAEKQYPHLLQKIMGKTVSGSENKFSAMAASLAQTGALVYIPKGVEVLQPLYSLLWGAGVHRAYLSHVMVYLEEASSLTYVHEAASGAENEGQSMHSGILEIYVGSGAKLRFVELQSWGQNIWNFTHEHANVDRDGSLEWIFGAIGSHLTKTFATIDLIGKGSSGKMSGFYFTDQDQHLDHDTQQNHLAPNTTSDLMFKGALMGESRSVWRGMIYVAPGSDKTDGYQENRNLILSPNARADSIPGLQILADDVRCKHGATVGKIDADQVFYLLSRGINKKEAEQLIVEGFFDPVIQKIPLESVRERLEKFICEKMNILQC